ncbi:hypothetical protein COLO4_37546 [Corchorus olitorius]|uniref:Uncharacterized protein n=1 Tax=Corchorus olitorius TaxID=93759 RepID=A0A1R3G0V7_9ROSI|nr:hypothetical protein COLO4_37546 [Corchorus olitorius]
MEKDESGSNSSSFSALNQVGNVEMEKVSPELVLHEAEVKIEKVPKKIDLNVPADCGFDLNKFPVEGNEVFADKEFQEVVTDMLKCYLPKWF